MKRYLLVILIIAVASVALVACVTKPPVDGTDENPQTPIDSFWTKGFTRERISASEMFSDLIGGTMQSLRQASSEVIPSETYKTAAHAILNIEYNGIKSQLVIKANYDYRKPEDTVVTCEVFSSDNQLQIGVYAYQQSGFTNLYISLEDNKIKIPLTDFNLSDIFPLDLQFDASASNLVASGFRMFMDVKGNVDYEYKTVNNYCERHYRFEVDAARSLTKLVMMTPDWQETMGMSPHDIDLLCRNLLGINSADVLEGNMPATTLKVEFTTQGGNPNYPGMGKLTKLKLNLKAEAMQNADTVFGKDFDIILDATQIKITNSVVSDIPKESKFSTYTDYSDLKFRFYCAMQAGSAPACDITVDFVYDGENGVNTCFALSAVAISNKQELCSIYYKSGRIYLNWLSNNVQKNIQCQFDFNRFILNLESQVDSAPSLNFVSFLSYIMASLRLQNDGSLSYSFTPQFFTDLATLDSDMFLQLLQSCSTDDISALLLSQNATISDLYKSFILSINYNSKLVEQIQEVTFPTQLDRLK